MAVWKRLTFQDRKQIAQMYSAETSILDIAHEIGCHHSTIYDELRRGFTGQLDQNERQQYDPKLAQRRSVEARRRRGNRTPRK